MSTSKKSYTRTNKEESFIGRGSFHAEVGHSNDRGGFHQKRNSFIGKGSHHAGLSTPSKGSAQKPDRDSDIKRVASPLRHAEGMDEL